MRWFRRKPVVPSEPSPAQRRRDARDDAYIAMAERAALPCVMCDEIGEPHVCERAWWQQRLAHYQGQTCADAECACHKAARLDAEAADLRSLLIPGGPRA